MTVKKLAATFSDFDQGLRNSLSKLDIKLPENSMTLNKIYFPLTFP